MRYEPRRLPRHETVIARGIEHHVLRWGPPSDDAVVMLHGWADTADTFQFVVDELPDGLPVASFDWRGFGRSGWDAGGYWFPDYFADLDQLLDVLCPGAPARLVGHSMGGNVALAYAGIRPGRVRAVVDLEGFGLRPTEPAQAPERYAQWLDQLRQPPEFSDYAGHDDLAARLRQRNPRLDEARAAFIAASWAAPQPGGGVRLRADPAHKLVNPYLYRQDETTALWRRIAAPVLLVIGELSELPARLGLDEVLERLRTGIGRLEVARVAGAGHMLHHERPAEVARLLQGFLEGTAIGE